MPASLSPLGIFHTLISLISIASGAISLLRDRRIAFGTALGKAYVGSMLVTCLTGFGIFRSGAWSPAHTLTVLSLIFLLLGVAGEWRGKAVLQAIGYSTSFFLLMIFTVTEALTRLPPGQPFAADQNAPLVNVFRLIVLAVFVIGIVGQVRAARRARTA